MDLNLADLKMPEDEVFAQIITCEIDGFLEPSDLAALVGGSPEAEAPQASSDSVIQPPPVVEEDNPADLKKIREKHHSVARLVASGLSHSMVAQLSGYTASYLSVLLNNPSMEELVSFYRAANGNAAQVITENLRTVGSKALEKLASKIEGDQLNPTELIAAAKLGFDRAGHGPKTTHEIESKTHVFDHAAIAELNRKALSESRENIVPVSQIRSQLEYRETQEAVFEEVDEAEDQAAQAEEQGEG